MSSPILPPHSARRRISASELAEAVHARDGAAFLVEPRVLRRVIKADRDITNLGLQVPHRKSYVVHGDRLLEIVDLDELHPAVPPGEGVLLPEQVILLPLPDAEQLGSQPADQLLLRHWRLFFHAKVHVALEGLLAEDELTEADVRERIHRIGQTQFDEIRSVLRSEELLLPPRDDATVFVEFAAVFLELRYFAPALLSHYFPTINAPHEVAAVLADDLDAASLFEQTRLAGAAEPPRQSDQTPMESPTAKPTQQRRAKKRSPTHRNGRSERKARRRRRLETHDLSPRNGEEHKLQRLEDQAAHAERNGNLVRGAILRMQAAAVATGKHESESVAAATENVKRLVQRLQAALEFANAQRSLWEESLKALLRLCSDDRLTAEGRLLYDLQKICDDHEREIYTVDLAEWLLSLGRQPIRRPLPALREVLICKHLHRVLRNLPAARLPEGARERFDQALRDALHHVAEDVRHKLRPAITKALHEVGLRPGPHNLPEEVGRNKIVEELLDKIVENGYLRFGDLRDAISRNQLKLPDLISWHEPQQAKSGLLSRIGSAIHRSFFGDHLLRADRELSRRLDGVYHRAELYLRLFQRISSFSYGTAAGRMVNRIAVLPLLAAFVMVVFCQEVGHWFAPLFSSGHAKAHAVQAGEKEREGMAIIDAISQLVGDGVFSSSSWSKAVASYPGSMISMALLSAFFLGLFTSSKFRQGVVSVWKRTLTFIGTAIRRFIDWLAEPIIQAVLTNPWFVFIRRYVFKPLLFATCFWTLLRGLRSEVGLPGFLVIFLACVFLTNTRWGRDAEEIGNDWVILSWHRFHTHVLAGLFWLIIDVSKICLEAVDRTLYAVDEWLRFRKGESFASFVGKAVLGAVWSVVTYVVRFAVNLLIEPQVNPIKHFPVVTVSHKVMLALAAPIGTAMAPHLGWETKYAIGVVGLVGTLIPGIFGFLAWELKENWRLYQANRPANLRPAIIGHHGETMVRLMRPGFHSGTLPKLYRKLRRAHRRSRKTGEPVAVLARKQLGQLEHVQHSLVNHFQRELLHLLKQSPAWRWNVTLGRVDLGSNRIRVELLCPELDETSCCLVFKEQSRWLVTSIEQPGWISRLNAREKDVLRNAIVGLYKTAGAHLIHEHVQGLLPRRDMPYDVADEGLIVWPCGGYQTEAIYDLDAEGEIEPRLADGQPAADLPPLDSQKLLFNRRPLAWDDWVAAWKAPKGKAQPRLMPEVRVFPEPGQATDDAATAERPVTLGSG